MCICVSCRGSVGREPDVSLRLSAEVSNVLLRCHKQRPAAGWCVLWASLENQSSCAALLHCTIECNLTASQPADSGLPPFPSRVVLHMLSHLTCVLMFLARVLHTTHSCCGPVRYTLPVGHVSALACSSLSLGLCVRLWVSLVCGSVYAHGYTVCTTEYGRARWVQGCDPAGMAGVCIVMLSSSSVVCVAVVRYCQGQEAHAGW